MHLETGAIGGEKGVEGCGTEELIIELSANAGQSPVMQALLIIRGTGDQFQQTALFETDLQSLEGVPETEGFVV